MQCKVSPNKCKFSCQNTSHSLYFISVLCVLLAYNDYDRYFMPEIKCSVIWQKSKFFNS